LVIQIVQAIRFGLTDWEGKHESDGARGGAESRAPFIGPPGGRGARKSRRRGCGKSPSFSRSTRQGRVARSFGFGRAASGSKDSQGASPTNGCDDPHSRRRADHCGHGTRPPEGAGPRAVRLVLKKKASPFEGRNVLSFRDPQAPEVTAITDRGGHDSYVTAAGPVSARLKPAAPPTTRRAGEKS